MIYTISRKDINRINRILSLQGLEIIQHHNSNEQLFLFTKRELEKFEYRIRNNVINEINSSIMNSVGSLFGNTSLSY